MKINQQIRASSVRLIGADGKQVGIVTLQDALRQAKEEGLDLVEVVPTAKPPVCKIIDYGKLKYDQTKREKISKKSQHQVKVKEIKFKPNIDSHDLEYKIEHAKTFLQKGNKVRFTCMFRGREMLHTDIGFNIMKNILADLEELCTVEAPPKLLGRNLSMVIAPLAVVKKS